ncbi:MAG: transcription elongation factor Spt5 [Candidatus Micrarchaeota archaeon]|nr:transcription elongation factor Spt5 [Candidatus Micrarchaeota archaeon]MDE1823810.1 transcription elongation factor Spt5 [Candidatus Micrarchaeota archaeon]MDE1849501.1 transcription elongation factor Spt5 [Candidatus Micrarchaeota archaeon]
MYFIVRVTASQEKITSDILQNKVGNTNQDIYSIVMPYGMRGYIIVEAKDEIACRELIMNEPHVKGMLPSSLSEAELDKMLAQKKEVQEIGVNDVVEFFSGPYKGYKAKVIKVNTTKEEMTVLLMDVPVQIPVTTKSNMAKIIQKAESA